MESPTLRRVRGRTVISATAIVTVGGRFRPDAVIQSNGLDSTVNSPVPFDGPLFDSYFEAAQYALEVTDAMYVQLQRVRRAATAAETST